MGLNISIPFHMGIHKFAELRYQKFQELKKDDSGPAFFAIGYDYRLYRSCWKIFSDMGAVRKSDILSECTINGIFYLFGRAPKI